MPRRELKLKAYLGDAPSSGPSFFVTKENMVRGFAVALLLGQVKCLLPHTIISYAYVPISGSRL